MTPDPDPTTPQPPDAGALVDELWAEIAKRCGHWTAGAENVIKKKLARVLRQVSGWHAPVADEAMRQLAQLRAENARLLREAKDWKDGADVEAFCGDEARAEVGQLRADLAAAAERERVLREAAEELIEWAHTVAQMYFPVTGQRVVAKAKAALAASGTPAPGGE